MAKTSKTHATDKVERIKRELRAHGAKAFIEARINALDVSKILRDLKR